MNKKFISVLLLATSLFCLFQSTKGNCEVKLYKNEVNNLDYIYYERDFTAPFTAWGWQNPVTQDVLIKKTFSSVRGFQASDCVNFYLTIFSNDGYNGRTEYYNLNNVFESALPFCAKSIMVQCPTVEPEEEEGEPEEEEQGEFLWYQMLDSSVYNEPFFVNLRDAGIPLALNEAIAEGHITSWPYTVTETRSIEKAVDFDYIYRYEEIVLNNLGDSYSVNLEIINDPASAGPVLRSGGPYNYVYQVCINV